MRAYLASFRIPPLALGALALFASSPASALSFTSQVAPPLGDPRLSTSWKGTTMVEVQYWAESPGIDQKFGPAPSLTAALASVYAKYKATLQSTILAQAQNLIAAEQSKVKVPVSIGGLAFQLGNPQFLGFTDTGKQQFGMTILLPRNSVTATVNFPLSWCLAALGVQLNPLVPVPPVGVLACQSPTLTVSADIEMGFMLGIQGNTLVVNSAAARVLNVGVFGNNFTGAVIADLAKAFAGGLSVDVSIGMPNDVASAVNSVSTNYLAKGFAVLLGAGGNIAVSSNATADMYFTISRGACINPAATSYIFGCDGSAICVPPSLAAKCIAANMCGPNPYGVADLLGNKKYPPSVATNPCPKLGNGTPLGKPACENPSYFGPLPAIPREPTGAWLQTVNLSCVDASGNPVSGAPQQVACGSGMTWSNQVNACVVSGGGGGTTPTATNGGGASGVGTTCTTTPLNTTKDCSAATTALAKCTCQGGVFDPTSNTCKDVVTCVQVGHGGALVQ
jgi:hypothetical protein